ncbi:nucleoside 2-deoxyribosyltransferase [Oscillospiraceae bacterium 42-9]|jgi:nucleoside 2-deoxyribosyltransferase|uniref:nucleoside 2-deoxyribosyltransferase n=1 Tax=Acutalibacter sp. TaxID=1918636 RepID=UPI00216ECE63|nr:group-specific protein [Acutalibacter sp.]
MKFYIGSSLQNREAVSWYAQRLKEHGWEHAYDWTKLEPAAAPERLAEIAQRERQGVRDAEVVILLLPGGRGTHVELGLALALGKKVFLCAGDAEAFAPENTVAFYQLPGVVRLAGTDRENLERILECAGPLYPSGMPVGE